MWLVRENVHGIGTAYVLDEKAREISFCQTVKDAEMMCKIKSDRDALLKALKDFVAITEGSGSVKQAGIEAIAQAEKEG